MLGYGTNTKQKKIAGAASLLTYLQPKNLLHWLTCLIQLLGVKLNKWYMYISNFNDSEELLLECVNTKED